MVKNGQKWPKMAKNGQKWHKMAKNGIKWPKMAKNNQKTDSSSTAYCGGQCLSIPCSSTVQQDSSDLVTEIKRG
jgi:hypothetical protein